MDSLTDTGKGLRYNLTVVTETADQIDTATLFRNAQALEKPSGAGLLWNRSFAQRPKPSFHQSISQAFRWLNS